MPHYVAFGLGLHCLPMTCYGLPGKNGLTFQIDSCRNLLRPPVFRALQYCHPLVTEGHIIGRYLCGLWVIYILLSFILIGLFCHVVLQHVYTMQFQGFDVSNLVGIVKIHIFQY